MGQKNGMGGVGRNFDVIGVNPNIGIVQKNGLCQNKMELGKRNIFQVFMVSLVEMKFYRN